MATRIKAKSDWPKIRTRSQRGKTYYQIDCGIIDGHGPRDVVYSRVFGRQLAGRRVRIISYEIFWAWMGRDLGVRVGVRATWQWLRVEEDHAAGHESLSG